MKRWDEPSLKERERLMGYKIDATQAGHVTVDIIKRWMEILILVPTITPVTIDPTSANFHLSLVLLR